MSRIALAAALVLLASPIVDLPVAVAQDTTALEELRDFPDYPALPPAPRTGVLIVDEEARRANTLVNEDGSSTWFAIERGTREHRDFAAQGGTLTIFRDGVGPDGGFGGFGNWTVLGDEAWQVVPDGHAGGLAVYQTAEPDGGYPSLARTLLLTPELDLRSGFEEQTPGRLYDEHQPDDRANGLLDDVWDMAQDTRRTVVNFVSAILGRPQEPPSDTSPPAGVPDARPSLPDNTRLYRFSFDLRMNVNAGRDGLQVWAFRERPTTMPPACVEAQGCEVVTADLAYDGGGTALPGAAWTARREWTRASVDILGRAGESVWFGFAFASASCPPGCLEQGNFADNAGFYGVQLDRFEARIGAPEHSLRLRPLAEPSVRPEGRPEVTVSPSLPVDVVAEVANLGRSRESFNVTLWLEDLDGARVAELPRQWVNLTAGWTALVAGRFPPLPVGNYTAHAALEGVTVDQDPSDNVAPPLRFDVERVEAVRLLGLAPSSLVVPSGAPLSYGAVVRNVGNAPVNVTATPELVDVTDSVVLGTPPTPASGLLLDGAQAIPLGIGEQKLVRWRIDTAAPRQVQLSAAITGSLVRGPASLVGAAVGIDRMPPPLFYQDEPGEEPRGLILPGHDWVTAGALGVQEWRTGEDYANDPGVTHYMGLPPGASCPGNPVELDSCRPFALNRDPSLFPNPPDPREPVSAELVMPPVFVDPAAPDPHLVFEHQFATSVLLRGCLEYVRTCPQAGGLGVNGIAILEGRRGLVNATGGVDWVGDWVQLTSRVTPIMRGAVGEATAGIHDPSRWDRDYDDSAPFCTGGRPCQWWWPSATNIDHRPPGGDVPGVHSFSGSPWLVEEVPLTGFQGDPQEGLTGFDARGMLFQARFRFPHAGHSAVLGQLPPTSEGWRLGTVAVVPMLDRQRDVRVEDVRVETPYDAEALGLGPATTVHALVRIRNMGSSDLEGVQVRVDAVGKDGESASLGGGTVVVAQLRAGETRNVTVPWTAPAVEGTLLRLKASASTPGGVDDFPGDNSLWDRHVHTVRAYRDLAAVAAVTPASGSLDTIRILTVAVENRGNVPVQSPAVSRGLERRSGLGQPQSLGTLTWQVLGQLDPGETAILGDPSLEVVGVGGPALDPSRHLLFRPAIPGEYTQRVQVRVDGGLDANPGNDLQAAAFSVASNLYLDPFDQGARRDPIVVSGLPAADGDDIWGRQLGGAAGSGSRLAAGDPETGELPANADGSYVLPPLDLTVVKRATLTFAHRFALEEGFDAGRVELSVDGGQEWHALRPRADPVRGLPLGYSSAELLTDTPLIGPLERPEGIAYTGNSADLPPSGLGPGWVTSEFDLAQFAGLRRTTTVEAFPLEGMAEAPLAAPRQGVGRVREGPSDLAGAPPLQFTHPTWQLGEEGAATAERHWWVENRTFALPPLRTPSAWWSGWQGTQLGHVDTWINFTAAGTNLTWWDWRDGWRDGDRPAYADTTVGGRPYRFGEALARDGTGARFLVELGGVDRAADSVVVERRDDGWTHRRLEVPAGATVSFHYISQDRNVANRGWIVDDVRTAPGPELPPVAAGHRTGNETGYPVPYQPIGWSCIGQGEVPGFGGPCRVPGATALARPGGWHLNATRPQADGSVGPSWRFADGSDEGYPSAASARLVTPMVDLRKVAGSQAWLRFDHRYDFQASGGCLKLITSPPEVTCDGSAPVPPPLDAQDGGVVEVQVLNETTGRFEPWQVLVAARPSHTIPILLTGPGVSTPWVMYGNELGENTPLDYGRMGYPALMPPKRGADLPRADLEEVRAVSLEGLPFPLSFTPVYSGQQGDWTTGRFDLAPFLGRQVRFAFHAWTDATADNVAPRLGWEVSNVAVEGDAFEGKPVLVRLRAVTDQSRLKGEWSIDNLQVSGDLYRKHVVVVPDAPVAHGTPGQDLVVAGNVSNLGADEARGFVLRAAALDAQGGELPACTDAETGPCYLLALPEEPATDLPEGLGGQVALVEDLVPGGRAPFRVLVRNLPEAGPVQVHLRLLQDLDRDAFPPKEKPRYGEPVDEVRGAGRAVVAVLTEHVQDLRFVRPATGGSGMSILPFAPSATDEVSLGVTLRNHGTATEARTVVWTIVQRQTGDQATVQVPFVVAPGEEAVVEGEWTPGGPGVYRITARVADLQDAGQLQADVPVETPLQYLDADFADEDAWALTAAPGTGGAQPNNAWTLLGDSLRWGVPETDFSAANNYCFQDGAALCASQADAASMGPSATAGVVEPLDLRFAPGDAAWVFLSHEWSFAPGDGGVVEVAAFTGPDGTPACTDGQGTKWFRITPDGGYPGRTASTTGEGNALGNVPAFAGRSPAGGATSVFDLASQDLTAQAQGLGGACAAIAAPGGLVGHNRYLGLRLRVGAQAGSPGERGWLVTDLAVGNGALRLGPREAPDTLGFERVLPVLDGAPKRFLAFVTNEGPVGDHATLQLAGDALAPPGWVALPAEPVPIAPGERRAIPFDVSVPPEEKAPRAVYSAPLVARSGNAPDLTDRLLVGLQLLDNPLPDLSVKLRLDGGVLTEAEAGSPLTVTAVVTNIGRAASEPVKVRFVAQPEGAAEEVLAEHLLPALNHTQAGRIGSFVAVGAEWITPDTPGPVTLRVLVDEAGRLTEQRRDNNEESLALHVVGSDAPDLAITDLTVTGVGEDGFAEAGSFMVFNATVTNLGRTAAQDTRVQIVVGGSVILEAVVRQLGPGQNATVSTVKPALPGEFLVRALALSTSSKADPNPDNDQATRLLRVRGHSLEVALPGVTPSVAPGARTDTVLRLANEGNAPDRVRLELVGSPGWSVEAFPNPLVVLAGSESRAFLLVSAPANASAGLHQLRLRAVPVTAPTQALAFDLPVRVDATDTGVRVEPLEAVAEGMDARLTLRVTNLGNVPRTVSVAVGGDGEALPVAFQGAGERVVRVAHRLAAAPQTGALRLPVVAYDAGGVLASIAVPVEVRGLPVLQAEWSAADLESQPTLAGQVTLRLKVDVANHGNAGVLARPVLEGFEGILPALPVLDLPAGGTAALEIPLDLPREPGPLEGRLRLLRDDDPSIVLAELDLPALPPQPNLRIESWSLPDEAVRAGDRVTARFTLRNNGTALSPPTAVLVYLDRTLVQALQVRALDPGDSIDLEARVAVPEGLHALIVLADGQARVSELRKDDNGASAILEATASRGLAVPGAPAALAAFAALGLAALLRRRRA